MARQKDTRHDINIFKSKQGNNKPSRRFSNVKQTKSNNDYLVIDLPIAIIVSTYLIYTSVLEIKIFLLAETF